MYAIAAMLKKNTKLEKLYLGHNNAHPASMGSLFHSFLQNKNSKLCELFIDHSNMNARGAVPVADALASNCSLQVVNLSHNSIGDIGATSIAQALLSNSTLHTLQLQHNGLTQDGLVMLMSAFVDPQELSEFELLALPLPQSSGLQANETIQVLQLGHIPASEAAFGEISQALSDNEVLRVIPFSYAIFVCVIHT
jgi:hypothetical protein